METFVAAFRVLTGCSWEQSLKMVSFQMSVVFVFVFPLFCYRTRLVRRGARGHKGDLVTALGHGEAEQDPRRILAAQLDAIDTRTPSCAAICRLGPASLLNRLRLRPRSAPLCLLLLLV